MMLGVLCNRQPCWRSGSRSGARRRRSRRRSHARKSAGRWKAIRDAGHWQELEQVSNIWGGDYFATYVDLNPAPRLADVQRAMAVSGDALLRADHWNAKLKAAEARAEENKRIHKQAEMDAIIAENERQFEASLFRPDVREFGGYVDTLQRLKDYNTSVNQSNCAVAYKGGLRSCSR